MIPSPFIFFCKTIIFQLYIIKVNNRYTIIIYIQLKGDDIMKFNLDEAKLEAVNRNGEKISFGGNLSVEMSSEELVQLNIMEFAKNFIKENERRDLEKMNIELKKENEKLKKEFRSKVNEMRDFEEIISALEKENKKLKLKLDRIKFGSSPVNE